MKSLKPLVPLVVALLILVAFSTGCQSNKKKTPKALAERRWAAARAQLLGSLAKSQLEAGNFEKSRQTIEEAQRLDPENAALRILYAKLAIEQGLLDVADRELTVARTLDPKSAEADYLSGIVYQRWQKPQTACDYYGSAAQKNPKEVAYPMAQAEMMIVLGREHEALALLQGQLEQFGTSAPLHDAIGQLFMAQGDYAPAVESLRQAHLLSPDDLLVREHLAIAQFYNGEYRDAAGHLSRLLREEKHSKRGDLHVTLGECQMHLGRTREARNTFDNATKLSPTLATAWLSLSKASLDLNDTRRATLALQRAVALAPQNPEVYLMLGYVRLREQRLPEALNAFRKANALDNRDPVSLCMIGYVLEKSGRPEQAIRYYSRALQLKPNDELAMKLMASVDMSE